MSGQSSSDGLPELPWAWGPFSILPAGDGALVVIPYRLRFIVGDFPRRNPPREFNKQHRAWEVSLDELPVVFAALQRFVTTLPTEAMVIERQNRTIANETAEWCYQKTRYLSERYLLDPEFSRQIVADALLTNAIALWSKTLKNKRAADTHLPIDAVAFITKIITDMMEWREQSVGRDFLPEHPTPPREAEKDEPTFGSLEQDIALPHTDETPPQPVHTSRENVAMLAAVWPQVIGEVIAKQTRPIALNRNTLVVSHSQPSALAFKRLRRIVPLILPRINETLGRPIVAKISFEPARKP